MNVCSLCNQPYGPNSCTKTHIKYTPRGELKEFLYNNGGGDDGIRISTQILPRIKVGAFNDFFTAQQYQEQGRNTCHDCGASIGGYHHAFCDEERCPRCGRQLLSCDCGDDYDIEFLENYTDEFLNYEGSNSGNNINDINIDSINLRWR